MKMRVVSVSCSVCRVPHFGRGLSTTWAKDPPNNLGPTCAKLDPNSSQAGPKLAASWPTLTPGWDHVVQTLDRNGEFGLAIFWRNYRGLGSVLASTVGRKWPPLASRNCTNTLHVNCHVLAPLARAYLKYMTIVLECLLWIVFFNFVKPSWRNSWCWALDSFGISPILNALLHVQYVMNRWHIQL